MVRGRTRSLEGLIDILCRSGSDPILRAFLDIDDKRLQRLRRNAASDTLSDISEKEAGVSYAFQSSKFVTSIPVPLGVKYEIRLNTIFLYRNAKDGFSQFEGQLPLGVQFGDKIEDILDRLGHPLEFREAQTVPGLGQLYDRAQYDCGSYRVWLQFDLKGELDQVSLEGCCY